MMRTLARTNDNLAAITEDLRALSARLNDPDNLVGMLTDSTMGDVLREAVFQLHAASGNAQALTDGVNALVNDVQRGEGAIGVLMADPVAEEDVRGMLDDLRMAADTLGLAIGRIDRFSKGLQDEGVVHALTQDTTMAADAADDDPPGHHHPPLERGPACPATQLAATEVLQGEGARGLTGVCAAPTLGVSAVPCSEHAACWSASTP